MQTIVSRLWDTPVAAALTGTLLAALFTWYYSAFGRHSFAGSLPGSDKSDAQLAAEATARITMAVGGTLLVANCLLGAILGVLLFQATR